MVLDHQGAHGHTRLQGYVLGPRQHPQHMLHNTVGAAPRTRPRGRRAVDYELAQEGLGSHARDQRCEERVPAPR